MNKKFVPENDIAKNNPDKDFIAGPYSTFDPELSQLSNQISNTKNPQLKGNLIAKLFQKSNAKVSKMGAKLFSITISLYFNSALKDSKINEKFKNFNLLANEEKILLGQMIINYVTEKLNKENDNIIPKIFFKRM